MELMIIEKEGTKLTKVLETIQKEFVIVIIERTYVEELKLNIVKLLIEDKQRQYISCR